MLSGKNPIVLELEIIRTLQSTDEILRAGAGSPAWTLIVALPWAGKKLKLVTFLGEVVDDGHSNRSYTNCLV